jgi:hypothetical protein
MKSLEGVNSRKARSLYIGLFGSLFWMFGNLIMPNLDAVGIGLIILALVMYFRK